MKRTPRSHNAHQFILVGIATGLFCLALPAIAQQYPTPSPSPEDSPSPTQTPPLETLPDDPSPLESPTEPSPLESPQDPAPLESPTEPSPLETPPTSPSPLESPTDPSPLDSPTAPSPLEDPTDPTVPSSPEEPGSSTEEPPLEDSTPTPLPSPSPDPTEPSTQGGSSDNSIVGVATDNQSFSILTQAIQAAGLTETLSGQGPYTVFAPTNEAFEQLPEGALQFLLQPENRALLQQVLTYHVVAGELPASQIQTGGIDTLSGGLAVRVTPDRIVVNNASVVQSDIQANNGVIHAVNRVLLPETLRQQLETQLGVQQIY